jgi:hypothetical protein
LAYEEQYSSTHLHTAHNNICSIKFHRYTDRYGMKEREWEWGRREGEEKSVIT